MSEDKSPTQKILRRIRKFTAPKDRTQLRELLRNAAGAGLLDSDALSMVEGVLDVSDLQVRDIMVPHNQMICVRSNDPAQRILAAAIDSGHSRFPVLDAEAETVVGILLAKDLLKLFAVNRADGFHLRDWMRKPVFVPESKRVNVLLKELRVGRNHMAIAVDEYDIEDEQNIRVEADRQYLVRGRTRIGEFNEYFGSEFSDAAIDTVAGLVTQHFGRLPRRGEALELEGFEFRVMRADRRRVEAVRVTVPPQAPSSADSVAASEQSG